MVVLNYIGISSGVGGHRQIPSLGRVWIYVASKLCKLNSAATRFKYMVYLFITASQLRFLFSWVLSNFSTVESLLSGHPLLSGQLLKSRKYFQYNTVNKTPFERPPLLSSRGHLFVVPMSVLLLFLPLSSGQ